MTPGKPRAMVVAGVMSGTSADGVDVALLRVSPASGRPSAGPKVEVLGHRGFAYPRAVRAAVLRAMDAGAMPVAEMARLGWRLGAVYADCVLRAASELGVLVGREQPHDKSRSARLIMGHPLELVGMHGQTVYHQANASPYAGADVRATWQLGEAAVVRERCGVPVVSDFRPADLAAGGQGAPLVPMLDFCLFRSAKTARVLLNLGGIANVSVLPAGCALEDVVAFDTGPANMVMDALMLRGLGKTYDKDGRAAARGRVVPGVVETVMRDAYFSALPPKSCGREQYGAAFVERFVKLCGRASAADMVTTAAELTVRSVSEACRRFAPGAEVVAAGGGVRNAYVMRRLSEELGMVWTANEFGVEAQAKEAVAFALLAWLSWHGLPGNVPSATGAEGGRVLGKICW